MKFESIFNTAQLELSSRLNSQTKKSSVYESKSRDGMTVDSVTKALFESCNGSLSFENDNRSTGIIGLSGDGVARRRIREIFGKSGVPNMAIGCHPDFHHLSETPDLENGYSITLFMDIVGSTKLGKKYPIETAFNIKNTIIKYAIEIIQAFDGHVHRIMGDAVMAFFRTKQHEGSESLIMRNAIDSINCATYLIKFMEEIITPILEEQGAEEPIGIRVGIDYGTNGDVLWGNYGAFGAYEVTATSYNVDVAAKLQHAALTNTVMIGHNLKCLLGLGQEYTSILEKSGVSKKYVSPNYKVGNSQINYRQYKFHHEEYFKILPQNISGNNYKLRIKDSGDYYIGCSTAIEKYKDIIFETSINYPAGQTIYLIAEKNNTGRDCGKQRGITEKKYIMNEVSSGYYTASIPESTAYHGIHHMKFKIVDEFDRVIDSEKSIGVIVSNPILI